MSRGLFLEIFTYVYKQNNVDKKSHFVTLLPMLTIRLQRVGRKHDPVFRVVVTDSKTGPKSNKHKEIIGSYDARREVRAIIDTDRAAHWIAQGAQPSDTVRNALVDLKVIDGKKVNALPKKNPIIDEEKIAAEKAAEEEAKTKAAEEKAKVEEEKVAAAEAAKAPEAEETPVAEEVKEEEATPAAEEETPAKEEVTPEVEEAKEETPADSEEPKKEAAA